jgi:hypothetical protein
LYGVLLSAIITDCWEEFIIKIGMSSITRRRLIMLQRIGEFDSFEGEKINTLQCPKDMLLTPQLHTSLIPMEYKKEELSHSRGNWIEWDI